MRNNEAVEAVKEIRVMMEKSSRFLSFSGTSAILIAPSMLLFYGLSLINASKYTYGSIFWLGLCELVLGLICAFFPGKGLLFWSIGFGAVHILYGIYFYFRVESIQQHD